MEQTGQKQSTIFEVKCTPCHHGVFYRYTHVSCVMGYMVCVCVCFTYNNLVSVHHGMNFIKNMPVYSAI